MRVLLSTIGSRGEVQPLLGLALRLREVGEEVRVCVPPDFRGWIEGMGIAVTTVGPELRGTAKPGKGVRAGEITPELRRQLIEGTVAAQFAAVREAAEGCELVVGCGALQVAARSVAELLGIRYVHAHYCPMTLPSPQHAPPRLWPAVDPMASHSEQWAADARQWNDNWGPALNAQRTALGLAPVDDVRGHLFTERPWLAADPTLGPWPEPEDPNVFQTGAWILPDKRPLPPDLEAFLDAGEPPVYFGLGSVAAPGEDVSQVMIKAARDLGRRAILSSGWADLPLADDGRDCILVGDANHAALFPRVAAVVHHGGAGTTTAVARAGVPQVVLPQRYDQPYWAGRVAQLGIGVAHPQGMPTTDALATALSQVLTPETTTRAATIAAAIRTDGTQIAAESLIAAVR